NGSARYERIVSRSLALMAIAAMPRPTIAAEFDPPVRTFRPEADVLMLVPALPEVLTAPAFTSTRACVPQPARNTTRRRACLTRSFYALAGALQAIRDRGPFRAFGRCFDQDLLAAGGIQLAQRRVELVCVSRGVARHAQPIVDALVRTRERQHGNSFLQPGNLL